MLTVPPIVHDTSLMLVVALSMKLINKIMSFSDHVNANCYFSNGFKRCFFPSIDLFNLIAKYKKKTYTLNKTKENITTKEENSSHLNINVKRK